MATLLYDGRTYEINDQDVKAVLDSARSLATGKPGWLILGTQDGGQARLLISTGTSVAIHTGEAVQLR